jgi:regulator of protease activity HflC (stomatin/prohibitin superfamily)
MNILLVVGFIVVVVILALAIKIVRQYERAVVFRLGKLIGEKGPGIFVILPFVDRLVKVDLRVRELDVPRQTIISKDNVSLDVDAVVYYKVTETPGE